MRADAATTNDKANETNRKGERRATSMFQRTLDNLPDGVLLISPERKVVYANAAFVRLWSIPAGIMTSGDDARILGHVLDQLEEPVQFIAEVERLYGTHESSHDELSFKDGRIFSRRSVTCVEDGEHFGRIWIFTDVTDAWHSRFDALTGLPNRRAYTRFIPDFAGSGGGSLLKAVALLDVDNFKGYNDRYGHAAGDAVLKRIGGILAGAHADGDMAFRIGGEEFFIASRHPTEEAAHAFVEGIRRSIAAEGIENEANPPYGVITASIGLKVVSGRYDPDELFTQIDEALFDAKRAGRNRVVMGQRRLLRHQRFMDAAPVSTDRDRAA